MKRERAIGAALITGGIISLMPSIFVITLAAMHHMTMGATSLAWALLAASSVFGLVIIAVGFWMLSSQAYREKTARD